MHTSEHFEHDEEEHRPPSLEGLLFRAFANSVQQVRWFLLGTVLISGILLVQTYIPMGITNDQLVGAAYRQNVLLLRKQLQTETDQFVKAHSANPAAIDWPSTDPAAKLLANRWLRLTMGENMLKEAVVPERDLPLLNLSVPGNDFMPVVALFLGFACTGLWLIFGSMFQTVRHLQKLDREKYSRVIPHYLLFGVCDSEGHNTLTHTVRTVFVWVPTATLIVSTYFDMAPLVPVILAKDKVFTEIEALVIGRLIFLGVMLLWVTAIAVLISRDVKKLDSFCHVHECEV